MKRNTSLIWITVVSTVLVVQAVRKQVSQDIIDFRGEKISLSKAFSSYEAYEEDPANLNSPSELIRIERLILEARVRPSFRSRQEFIKATSDLKFPGYGYGCLQFPQPDGTVFYVVSVEIPHRNKERHLVARTSNDRLQVVDDFVLDGHSGLVRDVKQKQNVIRYFDLKGGLLRETEL